MQLVISLHRKHHLALKTPSLWHVILFEDSAAAITAPIAELASLVIGLFRGTAKLALIPAGRDRKDCRIANVTNTHINCKNVTSFIQRL